MAMSKATRVGAITRVGPKLAPPSAELAWTMALFCTSCQARTSCKDQVHAVLAA